MKNIFKIYKRDLKKIFTNSMAIILAVGIAVLPSLYAWFNIYANWDPYGPASTGNMKVAVVINDEGYEFKGVEIIEANACKDHIHMLVSIPPKISISSFMGYLKGKSTLMIYDRHPELQSKWDKAFWARGYYVATVGNITEEAVKEYIQQQKEESKREDTRR